MTFGLKQFIARMLTADAEVAFTAVPGEDIVLEVRPLAIDPPPNWRPGFQVRQLLDRHGADELLDHLQRWLAAIEREQRPQYILDVAMAPWLRLTMFANRGELESLVAMLREAVAWRDVSLLGKK